MNIGDVVEISYVDFMSKEEQILLRSLGFLVTVEDIDPLGGFYSKEFPGYLFTWDQLRV
jgi:hypothetical protein